MPPAWEYSALGGLALAGVVHGINPAMGWLFALFFGLHRQRVRALWLALGAVGAGHLLALLLSLDLLLLVRSTVPVEPLRIGAGTVALALGVARLFSLWRHPGWRGLNLGYGELALWATAMGLLHGGGLVFAPLVLGGESASLGSLATWAVPLLVHGAAAMATMALWPGEWPSSSSAWWCCSCPGWGPWEGERPTTPTATASDRGGQGHAQRGGRRCRQRLSKRHSPASRAQA
jgi:hypothetical protein